MIWNKLNIMFYLLYFIVQGKLISIMKALSILKFISI